MNTSPASSTPPSRIAVVGVGAIGSAFAFQLARVGKHDVTAVVRPGSPRLEQLRRDSGIVDVHGAHARLHVTDTLDETIPYDLVIVTLLAHQVDAVLPALQRSAAKCIQFMFNTFDPERLLDAVGKSRCAFGMPFVQSMLDADGRLDATIGAGGQKTKMSDERWVEVFRAAGLPAVREPDMMRWLRWHVPMCVAFESVSTVAVRRGGGASWHESMVVARGMHECFALLERLGDSPYPGGKAFLSRSPVWVAASMLWSMSRIRSFRELLATGIGECRALVDVMVEAAPRAQPPVALERLLALKQLDA